MNQLAIDFEARARRADPETSQEAAGRVDGKRMAERVLADLRANGPATSHEIAKRTGLDLVTVSPRMKPLETANLVKRAGRRDNRTVWEAL